MHVRRKPEGPRSEVSARISLKSSEHGSISKYILSSPTLYKISQRCPMRQVHSQQIYNIGLGDHTHKLPPLRKKDLPQIL